jgi:hypothetical protein
MLVALLALFVALGGPAQAAKLINGAKIKKGTVASKQVKNRSLKVRDLSSAAVRTLLSAPANSITARSLAPGSVLTGAVADNTIGAADLWTNSVGSDEIADNAVGQAAIRGNGVAAAEIADDSIDGGEIIDGGLSVRDVARHTGTFDWDVAALGTGACVTGWVPVQGAQIAGDFVLISPTAAWPDDLVYTANGTRYDAQFKVQACIRGAMVPAA